ncbi:hypothetical protein BGX28_001823 [Mortierella sp. GBA30]|nr:hypothetical protein BGX28_001823 [Mortierella sp. GBA30]
MSLTPASIDSVLQYLNPYLDTLRTGFPTASRPSEPALTREQKRQRISTTLQNDPGIFLTKWGSVILYPRPNTVTSSNDASTESLVNGDSLPATKTTATTAKDILDLFAPLATNYEVKYHLTRLYQQLQQLSEHATFESRQQHPSGSTAGINPQNIHQHNYAPSLFSSNFMDIEDTSSTRHNKDIPEEDRKPSPGQTDLFARSTLSQHTRRNRRLNYLLRHLAPPDASEFTSAAIDAATGKVKSKGTSMGGGGGSSSGHSNPNQEAHHHPTLANILSISGSMSNLSFSESTYFSDAEMEARAPELYQQYIGRFMDHDDDDNEGSEDVERGVDGSGAEDADDENEDDRGRPAASLRPFAKDVSLVDRILWNLDHPTRRQKQQELERRTRQQGESISSQQQQQHHHEQQQLHSHGQQSDGSSGSALRSAAEMTVPRTTVTGTDTAEEDEFEEEFDTESENEDSEMVAKSQNLREDKDKENDAEMDDRKGPLKGIADEDILARTSITPPIPPELVPGYLSSTLASAAMTLEQPEERARFAEIENGDDLDSDDGKEMDKATAERKEDQEALRQEFVLLMKQRFLDGLDANFDYSMVDFDEGLDDLEQEDHDEEDRWFDEEDDEVVSASGEGTSSRRGRDHASQAIQGPSLSSRMTYDERVQAWESSAQNGAGEYDY